MTTPNQELNLQSHPTSIDIQQVRWFGQWLIEEADSKVDHEVQKGSGEHQEPDLREHLRQ